MWRSVIVIVGLGIIAAGCESAGSDPLDVSGVPFSVGVPVTDPAVVTLVVSQSHTDTLTSERFSANLVRLNAMFPDVMADPAQEASIRREIVKQFVVEHLIMTEAKRVGIEVTSEDVATRLGEYRDSFASEDEYETELGRFGQTEADLAEQFHIELIREAISNHIEQQTPSPSDADVQEFRSAMAERLLAQHILFMIDETMAPDERGTVFETAKSVLDSAHSGVNFGDLARRHSDDIGTAQIGGELPWFRRGDMVAQFEEAAFALESPGQVTENLVETTYGYHVIRLVARASDEPVDVDSARSLLWRQQIRKAERELTENLQKNAEVRINPGLVPGFVD